MHQTNDTWSYMLEWDGFLVEWVGVIIWKTFEPIRSDLRTNCSILWTCSFKRSDSNEQIHRELDIATLFARLTWSWDVLEV